MESQSYLPLRDEVFYELRDRILKGELKPGDRLLEIRLAEQLGVSRTPVREALRLLEKEGLAVNIPRRGAQVARMTQKDLSDVLELREVLDDLAITKACTNINDEIIKKLNDALAVFKEAVSGGDLSEIVSADEAFHNVIYEAADNPRLMSLLDNLKEQMYRFRFAYVKGEKNYDVLIREHQLMIDGLKDKDEKSVKETMRTHLKNQMDAIRRIILSYDK